MWSLFPLGVVFFSVQSSFKYIACVSGDGVHVADLISLNNLRRFCRSFLRYESCCVL